MFDVDHEYDSEDDTETDLDPIVHEAEVVIEDNGDPLSAARDDLVSDLRTIGEKTAAFLEDSAHEGEDMFSHVMRFFGMWK